MGNRNTIQHYSSGLFLDCNGNNNYACPVLSGFKNNRDQWWIVYEKPQGFYRLKSDHHPRRRLTVLKNGKVQLYIPAKPLEWVVEETGDEIGTIRLRCPFGYLAGPEQAGPVYICAQDHDTPLTLWRFFSKHEVIKYHKDSSNSFSSRVLSPNSVQRDMDVLNTETNANGAGSLIGNTVQWVTSFVSSFSQVVGGYDYENGEKQESETSQQRQNYTSPSIKPKNQRITLVKSSSIYNNKPPSETIYELNKVLSFCITEGLEQTETLEFIVNEDVEKLKRKESTYKFGALVKTTFIDMGSFKSREEPYHFTFPVQVVPRGFLVRGKYSLSVEYLDVHGLCCVAVNSNFSIVKD